MKEVIGVDIDEVKFETLDELLKLHKYSINGKKISKDDITNYHLHKIPELHIDLEANHQRRNDFMTSEKVHDIKPVQGAKEGLEKIVAQGKKIISITGRSDIHKLRTYKALEKYYAGLISDVIFLNAYADIYSQKITQRTKSEICKEIGANIMIEDDLHYAQEIADNGIKVYLLAKPRNRTYSNGSHPNIIKVASRKNIDI